VAVNTDPRWMSYPLREKEPLLQFLPTILATWIVDHLSDDLELPNPAQPSADERRHHFEDHQGRKWSTSSLNWVLQHVLVHANDGSHLAAIGAIEHESELFEGTPRIRCRGDYRGNSRKVILFHIIPHNSTLRF
jgi:hypothetical protein